MRLAQAGKAAPALSSLEGRPFDLLLTDIVMPGADGIEVARVAAARQPGLRIMFITGFADAVVRLAAFSASRRAVSRTAS